MTLAHIKDAETTKIRSSRRPVKHAFISSPISSQPGPNGRSACLRPAAILRSGTLPTMSQTPSFSSPPATFSRIRSLISERAFAGPVIAGSVPASVRPGAKEIGMVSPRPSISMTCRAYCIRYGSNAEMTNTSSPSTVAHCMLVKPEICWSNTARSNQVASQTNCAPLFCCCLSNQQLGSSRLIEICLLLNMASVSGSCPVFNVETVEKIFFQASSRYEDTHAWGAMPQASRRLML